MLGGSGHRVASLAGAAAALLLAATLSGCGTDPAKTVTVLRDVHDTSVIAPSGQVRAGHDGTRLHPGDDVRTADTGAATLVTGGRRLLLGAATEIRVTDGTHATLGRGAALLDRRSGPTLALDVGEVTLRTDGATLARIERGYATRVGVYDGAAELAPPVGRGLRVAALHQAMVSGRGVPVAATPLALADDAWDQRAAPDLVAYDRTLNRVADGLDATTSGARLAAAVPASYLVAGPKLRAGEPQSESALALVIARASSQQATERARYEAVRSLRENGGSWAVVADLVDAPSNRFGQALAALLAERVPTTGVLLATGSGPGGGRGVVAAVDRPNAAPTEQPPVGPDRGRDNPPPSTEPPPSPSPSPGLIGGLLDALLGLLPLPPVSPSPTPTPSPAPAATAKPSPLLPAVTGAVTGLVGGLLGGPSPSPAP